MKALLKPKKDNNVIFHRQYNDQRIKKETNYTIEELTESNEKEVIFTVQLKINLKSKSGKKILKKMIETQTSPVKNILQEINSSDRKYIREGKKSEEYTLPNEIIKQIEEDFEIKKFETYNG